MNPADFKLGDAVFVDSYEGFGGPAVIIDRRDSPTCHFKVAMDDGSQRPFWAHDFELSPFPSDPGRYDSRPDTVKHIRQVGEYLTRAIANLHRRRDEHDLSKLRSPEREILDECTPRLAGLTFGSDEYNAQLAQMKLGLDHHYSHNSHHPEYWPKPEGSEIERLRYAVDLIESRRREWVAGAGSTEDWAAASAALDVAIGRMKSDIAAMESRINNMSLLDLAEMIVDWMASSRRHIEGNPYRSVEILQSRFGYSDEMKSIFINTIKEIEGMA